MQSVRALSFVVFILGCLPAPLRGAIEDTPAQRLADALAAAESPQAREALLSGEPELVTVDLRKTLSSQGDERTTRGEYANAVVRYELALAVAGRVGDELGAIESLNDLGRVYRYQGQYDRALQLLGDALERAETRADKGWIAATVNNLGNIHNMRGEYEDAVRYYERGLALSEELGLQRGVASTLVNLASIHSGQGDFPLATERLRRCLEIAEATGNKSVLAHALLNLGDIQRQLGEHETAIELLRKGLTIREELGNTSDIAAAHTVLGSAFLAQGDYARALDHYHRSLSIAEPSGEKARTAGALHNIGLVYQAQGDHELARDFFRRSLAMSEELGNKARMAAIQLDLARLSLEDGQVEAALRGIEQSLTLSEAAGERVAVASAQLEKGDAQRRQGQPEQAMQSFRSSLATSEALGHRPGVSSAWQRIGLLYLERGQPEPAVEALEKARDIARETHERERLWESSAAAGRAYRALRRPDRAQQAFAEAIATIEDLRADVAGGEAEQQRFFEGRVAPYQGMVALLVEEGRLADALVFAERAKARTLHDALRGGRAAPTRALTADERERDGRLRAAVVSLNVQLARAAQRAQPVPARLADLTGRLDKARREHADYQTRLYAAHPELRIERGETPPLDLEDAARLLGDGRTVVLEYAVQEDRVFLFVLTRGATTAGTRAAPVIELHEIKAGAAALRDQVRDLTRRIASRDLDLGSSSSRLYDLLVRPAQAAIRGKDRIVLVPDDVLWELPFQALRPASGRYLVEAAAVSYAPSLAVLVDMKRAVGRDAGSGMLLAMGNPVMPESVVTRARAVTRSASLGPLPDAEREVRTLGRLYGAGATKTYVGADAREDVLKAEAGRHRILHLATHGILNDSSPLYSYVLLTRGKESEEDGLLEAREIMGMELRADLAVLSACETARGRFGAGEGVVGLSWALFVAGCETTVVSQWKVASESTSDLMLEFHRRLRSGGRKDEALRRASLKLLADGRYRHPFYWAGFIVVGNVD